MTFQKEITYFFKQWQKYTESGSDEYGRYNNPSDITDEKDGGDKRKYSLVGALGLLGLDTPIARQILKNLEVTKSPLFGNVIINRDGADNEKTDTTFTK